MRTPANHHTIDDIHAILWMARALEEYFGDWYRALGRSGSPAITTPTGLQAHVIRHALTIQQNCEAGGGGPTGGPTAGQHDPLCNDRDACEILSYEAGGIERLGKLAYRIQQEARDAGEDC